MNKVLGPTVAIRHIEDYPFDRGVRAVVDHEVNGGPWFVTFCWGDASIKIPFDRLYAYLGFGVDQAFTHDELEGRGNERDPLAVIIKGGLTSREIAQKLSANYDNLRGMCLIESFYRLRAQHASAYRRMEILTQRGLSWRGKVALLFLLSFCLFSTALFTVGSIVLVLGSELIASWVLGDREATSELDEANHGGLVFDSDDPIQVSLYILLMSGGAGVWFGLFVSMIACCGLELWRRSHVPRSLYEELSGELLAVANEAKAYCDTRGRALSATEMEADEALTQFQKMINDLSRRVPFVSLGVAEGDYVALP